MASTRKFVKVFLASPGDLNDERRAARAIVDEFNSQLAEVLGYQVDLVGWEDTLPGTGRPQAIINRDLDGCDLFVGMIWKRWGTPPDSSGPFTSGFEEEFSRSMMRNQADARPEIHLLLKDVDAAALADPGDHLKKVIDFKNKVFAERKLLAKTFSDAADFETKFRRCIQGFVIKLAQEDSAKPSEKDQLPAPNSSPKIEASKSTLHTPFSAEGLDYLEELISTDGGPHLKLSAAQVARFRLLSCAVGAQGNDEPRLGPHDSNILYRQRSKFNFGELELNQLVINGFDHWKFENVPLWTWLNSIDGLKKNLLPLYSYAGPATRRTAALAAMTLIEESISDVHGIARPAYLDSWLADSAPTELKVAALNYLSVCGEQDDLEAIKKEYSRNESGTSQSAAAAIIEIHLKEGRKQGLASLYELQPQSIDGDLVQRIFGDGDEFDQPKLVEGLTHQSAEVRLAAMSGLRQRGALDPTTADRLTGDANPRIRLSALEALQEGGIQFSNDQAKAILIRKASDKASYSLGLSIRSDETEGEEQYEKFAQILSQLRSDSDLEAEQDEELLNQTAFFALARKNFPKWGGKLRHALNDRFESRFNMAFEKMCARQSSQTDLIARIKSLEDFVRQRFTSEALDIVSLRLDKADLPLIRKAISQKLDFSPSYIAFIAKFGDWSDIPTLIECFGWPPRSRRPTWLMQANIARAITVADAIYKLGQSRTAELLELTMPSELRCRLISRIPDSRYRTLSQAKIIKLLKDENDKVRKFAALKAIKVMPSQAMSDLLATYLKSAQVFYNVIHWLDFGISMNKDKTAMGSRKLLSSLE